MGPRRDPTFVMDRFAEPGVDILADDQTRGGHADCFHKTLGRALAGRGATASGGLRVMLSDGTVLTVSSGEVTVQGIY